MRAGVLYFVAIHADLTSLREGITFVIDTTEQPSAKVGNEAKLQKSYQSYPLRPQVLSVASMMGCLSLVDGRCDSPKRSKGKVAPLLHSASSSSPAAL